MSVFNEDFVIPDKLVGLVIGRGGEKIKRMQMESGCKIRISDSDGTLNRACILTGSQESIDEAKRMLDNIIKRAEERDTQGGGFNNGGGQPQQQFNNGGDRQQQFNNGGGQGRPQYGQQQQQPGQGQQGQQQQFGGQFAGQQQQQPRQQY